MADPSTSELHSAMCRPATSTRHSPGEPSLGPRSKLPHSGKPWRDLAAELEAAKSQDLDWRRGRLPLYVYWRDEALHRVSRHAYLAYFMENGLGRRAFPSVATLEREVIGMGLGLMQARTRQTAASPQTGQKASSSP